MYTPIKNLQPGSTVRQIFRCSETSKSKKSKSARKFEATKFIDITGSIKGLSFTSPNPFIEGKYYDIYGKISEDSPPVLFIETSRITSVSDECDYIKSVPADLLRKYVDEIRSIVKENSTSRSPVFIMDFIDDKKLFEQGKLLSYHDDTRGSVIEKLYKLLNTAQKIDKISDTLLVVALCEYFEVYFKNKFNYEDFDLLSHILTIMPADIDFKVDTIAKAKKLIGTINDLS